MEAAIVYLVLFLSGAYVGYDLRDDQAMELAAVEQRARDTAQIAAAEAIAKIKVENQVIYQPMVEKVRTETKYKNCVHDDEMMRLINAALVGGDK